MNYLHQWQLVEAEKYRVLGNHVQALVYYDEAIAKAKVNQYPQEESLANELAAKFYLDWGKERVAAGYMQTKDGFESRVERGSQNHLYTCRACEALYLP